MARRARRARSWGAEAQIGVTCHASRHMAMEAGEAGADYIAFGAFFPSTTKDKGAEAEVPDLELVRWWTTVFEIPLRRHRRYHAGKLQAADRSRGRISSPCRARCGTATRSRPFRLSPRRSSAAERVCPIGVAFCHCVNRRPGLDRGLGFSPSPVSKLGSQSPVSSTRRRILEMSAPRHFSERRVSGVAKTIAHFRNWMGSCPLFSCL